jgi:hypothetical protein
VSLFSPRWQTELALGWEGSSCPRSAWVRTPCRCGARDSLLPLPLPGRDAERPDVRAHAERGHEEANQRPGRIGTGRRRGGAWIGTEWGPGSFG